METPPQTKPASPPPSPSVPPPHRNPGRMLFGLLMMLLGVIALSNAFGWGWFANIAWWRLWPLLVIGWGIALLSGPRQKSGRSRTMLGWIIAIVLLVLLMLLLSARSAGVSDLRATPARVDRAMV